MGLCELIMLRTIDDIGTFKKYSHCTAKTCLCFRDASQDLSRMRLFILYKLNVYPF